jgi:2-keto-4-pentenoate hydratase
MDRAQALKRAGDILWDAWQQGVAMEALPSEVRPLTRAEGYEVQAALEGRSSGPPLGWKIAATSVAGQRHIQVDGPIAGRLLRERARDPGVRLSLAQNHMAVAEPEFAFCMGRDLPPRSTAYTVDEVWSAVASLHPAIEVPNSRFANFALAGEAQLIADNACAHEVVIGPAASLEWRNLDLVTHRVVGRVSGVRRNYEREGSGAAVLGSPVVALTWLVNELRDRGWTLKRDQIVITGASTTPLDVVPGDEVLADFGSLGSVSVTFGD